MENVDEFNRWLDQMLKDAKEKLNMSDRTIAFILFGKANEYYLRTICNAQLEKEGGGGSG